MVKKVISYRFTERFRKNYKALPKEIQTAFDKKLRLFLNDMNHPSLRVKRLQGTRDRWEGTVTRKVRFTFQISEEDKVIFRAIGHHDMLNKESR